MTLETLNILVYTQTILSALIAAIALWNFKKQEAYIRNVGMLFAVGFLANGVALLLYLSSNGRYVNIPQSMYDLFGFALVSLLFYNALNRRNGIFLTITVCYIAFASFNFLFLQKAGINSYNKFLSSTLITGYCIYYFYQLMVELPSTHLRRLPMFWFTSGLLMYHAGTIFLFAFTTYLTDVLGDDLITYWSFHNLLSIVQQLLIMVGLAYYVRRKTHESRASDL